MEDDRSLFERWCQDDRKSGLQLFDRHYPSIARFFANKAHESAVADLVQNTFLACVEARERFRGDSQFRTFLFAIAHNVLRKHYRDQRGGRAIDFEEVAVAELLPTLSEAMAARQEQRLLLEALRRIPIECQEVLELHYWEQMGTAEIGEVVGVPAGTVKSRLQRARRLLEDRLRRLASSPALLQSTLSDLDRWAEGLRKRALGKG